MDIATTLPAEIWQRIFELLAAQDIQTMIKVHRTLYSYARPFIWRYLVICSLNRKHRKQAKVILSNPFLGQHIKSLHIRPSLYESYGGRSFVVTAPTNVWVANPPIRTWFDLLRRSGWKHPIRSLKHFAYSKKTVSTALAVVPHLTQLRTLWISAWFSPIPPYPEPALYLTIWEKLHTNHLTAIFCSFSSWPSLYVFSDAIRKSQTSFPCLEILSIGSFFGFDDDFDPGTYEEAMHAIASTGRNSAKTLRISLLSRGQHPASSLFSGLGFFPNLVHFCFSGWKCDDERSLTKFLALHHTSLTRVLLEGHIHRLFLGLPQANLDSVSLKLTSLGLAYDVLQDQAWLAGGAPLQPYTDTLTTLFVSPLWYTVESFYGFSYQDLDRLASTLYRPGGALLQRLKIPINHLCPEIFDLLSTSLENLDTLSIVYHALVARVGNLADEPLLFWREMNTRRYLNWRIKRLGLMSVHGSGFTQDHGDDGMIRVIPSLECQIMDREDDSWWNLHIQVQPDFY